MGRQAGWGGGVGRDYVNVIVIVLSRVWLSVAPWIAVHWAPNVTGSDKVEIMQVKKWEGKGVGKKKVDKLTDCTGNRWESKQIFKTWQTRQEQVK